MAQASVPATVAAHFLPWQVLLPLLLSSRRYCVDCEEFKDDQDLDAATHACPTHRKPCQHRK